MVLRIGKWHDLHVLMTNRCASIYAAVEYCNVFALKIRKNMPRCLKVGNIERIVLRFEVGRV